MKNVPIEYFGFAFAGLNLISGIISLYAHKIDKKIKEKNVLALILIIAVLTYILLANINAGLILALFLPSLYQIDRALITVSISNMINKVTFSHHRATVISIKSFLVNLNQMIFLPIFGIIADQYGLLKSYNILAIFIFIFAGFSLIHFRKLKFEHQCNSFKHQEIDT